MQTYITVNDTIKYTDSDGVIHWIPRDEGNTDYQVFLKHTQTADDVAAQKVQNDKVAADKSASDAAETARLALVESGDAKLRLAGLNQAEIDASRL
jgi:precorrin-3B methylase